MSVGESTAAFLIEVGSEGRAQAAEKPEPALPENETPFQRFQRLAKRVVTVAKPPVDKSKLER